MRSVEPLPEAEAVDKVARTYGRIKELLGRETVPDVFLLYGRVPPFLQDFYLNFKKFVFTDGEIDAMTKSAIGIAVSQHTGCSTWGDFFLERFAELGGTAQQVAEIGALVATNAMYNTFFKFRENSGSELFSGMAVGLRAHTFANTSLSDQTVELVNLTISNLNACRPCTSGHVAQAKKLGLSDAAVLESVQCAATLYAGIQFLKGND